MDFLYHIILCACITFVGGWPVGLWSGFFLECVQAEYGRNYIWKKVFWERLSSEDSCRDMFADLIGVGIGLLIRKLILKS